MKRLFKIRKTIVIGWIILLLAGLDGLLLGATSDEECTIGVASGKATADGRPMIWKSRDNSSAPDVEMVYNTSYDRYFLELVDAGKTYAWMGVNQDGFAIVNSLASDLQAGESGLSNGALMRKALGTCGTVSQFKALLEATNSSGRSTHGNFAVLDSTGAAALFEISGDAYWKFDANDSVNAPLGFIIRTNFAYHGDGTGGGYERFARSVNLITSFSQGDTLNYRSILRYHARDFSDYDSNPVPVPFPGVWKEGRPFGYIYTNVSICRYKTNSTTVIQGILPGENVSLTTMWTMLGQPAASIAVPYWPVGYTPAVANGSNTAPLCDKALQIKSKLFDYSGSSRYIDSYKLRDGKGGGLWTITFPAEDSIFKAAEKKLEQWRQTKPTASEMLNAETDYANYALNMLDSAYNYLLTGLPTKMGAALLKNFSLAQNYPNPFNMQTRIEFTIPHPAQIRLSVYDVSGRQVAILAFGKVAAGKHSIFWNAGQNTALASGIYFLRLSVLGRKNQTYVRRALLLK